MAKKRKYETGILILEEKHDTQIIDVSTEEKLFEVCKQIVNARNDSGYWYFLSELEEPIQPTMPKPNSEDWMMKAYNNAIREYVRLNNEYESQKEEKELFEKALKDGEAAYHFLKNRECEYERFEIRKLATKYYG